MIWLLACTGAPDSATPTSPPEDSSLPLDSADSGTKTTDSTEGTTTACSGLEVQVDGQPLPSAGTLDFGASPSLSSAVLRTLSLHNPCADRLRFLGHPDTWLQGSTFSLQDFPPVYLEPDQTAAISLRFSPGDPATESGSFSLPYDQPGAPFLASLQAESSAPLRLVLAGDGGHLLSTSDYGLSSDFDEYTTSTAHTSALIRGICAAEGLYVAVGGNAERAWWSSPDGVQWTSGTDVGSPLADCAWYNGRFIASDGAPLWSTDGRSWTRGTGSLSQHLRAMAAGDQGVVGVGDNGMIARTTDGDSWLWSGQPITASLGKVVYGNGVYVAAGEGGVTVVSDDGENWVSSSTGGQGVAGLIFAGGSFFLGDGRSLYRSEDGVTWDLVNATGVSPMAGTDGILLGVYGLGLYRSLDQGFSWEAGAVSPGGLGFLDGVLEVGR